MRKLKDLQLVFTSVNMLHYRTTRQLDNTINILDHKKYVKQKFKYLFIVILFRYTRTCINIIFTHYNVKNKSYIQLLI